MTQDIAIRVQGLSKCYQIYDNPGDRLKQFIVPRIKRILGKEQIPYFREFWALKDVSFEVKRGETVGIIGRNGSGKSTLLQIICGTLTPTGGIVQTNGRIAALLELGSGFNPEFTGRENVYLNAAVLGLTNEEVDARFDEIIAFADIGDFIEQPVKTYSSGMMVRLAFAVIAHVNADILVVDEALAVGDVFFNQKCMRFLRTFMKTGTILFVSHDTSSIRNLCTKAMWLNKGVTKSIGTPKDISEAYLEAIYIENNEERLQEGIAKDAAKENLNKIASNLVADEDESIKVLINQITESAGFTKGSFGAGGATVLGARMVNAQQQNVVVTDGNQAVTLVIVVKAEIGIQHPIIGFSVKDKYGQDLFGENTYKKYQNIDAACIPGALIIAKFNFTMPYLQPGDYSISAAIADGTQEAHTQLHWVHDAIVFKSSCRGGSTGLVGIPMTLVELEINNTSNADVA